MKSNYAVLCYHTDSNGDMYVQHTCVYESKPTITDIQSLREELATDKEFGMTEDTSYKILVLDRNSDIANVVLEKLGVPAEF